MNVDMTFIYHNFKIRKMKTVLALFITYNVALVVGIVTIIYKIKTLKNANSNSKNDSTN